MENLILSFEVVAPLLVLMLLGFFIRHIGIFDDNILKSLNKAVFKIFLPVLIFYNVYNSDMSNIADHSLIIYAALCIIFAFLLLIFIIPLIEKDNTKRGVMIQGIFRSNFVIFGIPLSASLFGDQVIAKVAIMVAVIIPLYNFLAVISLELFRNKKPDFRSIALGIITNPLIIASLIGLCVLLSGIHIPNFLEDSLADISGMATPLALIVLGGSINFKRIGKSLRPLITVIISKLVILPLICLLTAIVLGFRSESLSILLSVFATPTAVSSYAMAQQMGGDDELAAQIVAFGTSMCVITIFLWIFLFKQFGLI